MSGGDVVTAERGRCDADGTSISLTGTCQNSHNLANADKFLKFGMKVAQNLLKPKIDLCGTSRVCMKLAQGKSKMAADESQTCGYSRNFPIKVIENETQIEDLII